MSKIINLTSNILIKLDNLDSMKKQRISATLQEYNNKH